MESIANKSPAGITQSYPYRKQSIDKEVLAVIKDLRKQYKSYFNDKPHHWNLFKALYNQYRKSKASDKVLEYLMLEILEKDILYYHRKSMTTALNFASSSGLIESVQGALQGMKSSSGKSIKYCNTNLDGIRQPLSEQQKIVQDIKTKLKSMEKSRREGGQPRVLSMAVEYCRLLEESEVIKEFLKQVKFKCSPPEEKQDQTLERLIPTTIEIPVGGQNKDAKDNTPTPPNGIDDIEPDRGTDHRRISESRKSTNTIMRATSQKVQQIKRQSNKQRKIYSHTPKYYDSVDELINDFNAFQQSTTSWQQYRILRTYGNVLKNLLLLAKTPLEAYYIRNVLEEAKLEEMVCKPGDRKKIVEQAELTIAANDVEINAALLKATLIK